MLSSIVSFLLLFFCKAKAIKASLCVDSESWHKKGETWKDCQWVSQKNDTRCLVKGPDKILASYACPGACGTPCLDSLTWHKNGDPSKDCGWVHRFPQKRCYVRGSDEERSLAMDACSTACGVKQKVRKERFSSCTSLGKATSSSNYPRSEENNEMLPRERTLSKIHGGECANYYWWRWEEPLFVDAPEQEDVDGGDSGGEGETPDGFSGTNVQEEFVDEADTVKSSGNLLFLATKTIPNTINETFQCEYRLSVVRDDDSNDLQLLASIPLAPLLTTPTEMLVSPSGDVLLLIGSALLEWEIDQEAQQSAYYYNNYQDAVILLWFDVSDPTLPRLLRRQIREGTYVSGRMIQDTAYLVISRQSWYSNSGPWLVPYFRDEIFDQDLDLTQTSLLSSVERKIDEWQKFGAKTPLEPSCDCSDVAYAWPLNSELGEFSTVLAINLASVEEAASASVASDTVATRADRIVYASTRAIYLTQQQYLGWTWWQGVDELTAEEEQEDEWEAPQIRTFVLKFDVDAESVRYSASFDVPGELVEQFALSETSDGTLVRFAATARAIGNWESVSNGIFVFDANTGTELGSVTHLAPGETIFSSRFVGDDLCFLVTFVRTDPLFAIAFENNGTTPVVLDELKIPGFSNYLHPVLSMDRIIGFGHDVIELETGVVTAGVQLSLFDITDNDLARLDFYTMGDAGSSSIATGDHKAFFYDSEDNVLAFPLTLATLEAWTQLYPEELLQPWTQGIVTFQGAYFFKVQADSLTYLGNVTHFDTEFFTPVWRPYSWLIDDPEEPYEDPEEEEEEEEEEDLTAQSSQGYWDTYFDTYASGYHTSRILRRGDALFTVSDNAIIKSSFSDLEQISRLELHDSDVLAGLHWLGNPFEAA